MNERLIFQTACLYSKIIYIIPTHLSVLKLQNYSSECRSCAFFRKIEGKLFWVIKAPIEASATNSIVNLNATLYFIADAKAVFSISYSSGNIQKKKSLSYMNLAKTLVSRGLINPNMLYTIFKHQIFVNV